MGYILGIDGGGTKTKAVIASLEGKVLAESTAGASSFNSVGKTKAAENLNQAVFSAAEKLGMGDISFKSAGFGFAGLNVEEDLKIYKSIVFNEKLKVNLNQEKVFICNDTRIGLEAGSSAKNKIIIIAGTGSNCFGINEAGQQAGCTGWDYILADEGSGIEVSIKALRAVMRAYDGRGEKTMLSRAVLDDLGIDNEEGIVGWTYGEAFSKERLGRFARLVCDCAGRGDRISQKILEDEAAESILSVSTVVNKLGLKDNEFDLVFVGGMFKCEEYFKNIVMGGLEKKYKGISFKPLVAEPVQGAIKLALNNL
jgi:N-acetylglucosamine kinase-like BadF-type ATPase